MEGSGRVAAVVGGAVAVLLQLIVAPNIAIGSIVPNFLFAYVVVVAVVRADTWGPVMPFVLGLVFDLAGGGPIGAMAFVFVLMTFLASRAFLLLDNGTLFMPIALVVFSMLFGEILYGVFLMMCGMGVGLLEALAYRGLPCALFDCVIGLVMYPLCVRFMAPSRAQQPGMPLMS